MNQPNESYQIPPGLVRRYTIVFLLSTLIGGVMVFLSVAGRRQALIDAEKAKRAAAEQSQAGSESNPSASTPQQVPQSP